jgi:hypothetical protein
VLAAARRAVDRDARTFAAAVARAEDKRLILVRTLAEAGTAGLSEAERAALLVLAGVSQESVQKPA